MSKRTWSLAVSMCLTGLPLLLCGGIRGAADAKPAVKHVAVKTVYLGNGIEGFQVLELVGEADPGGRKTKAKLVLNRNSCGLNEFGDRAICTKMAPVVRDVTLERIRMQDPAKKGRLLFSIAGTKLKGTLTLVLPLPTVGPPRLIYQDADGKQRRVVTTEPTTAPG